MQGMLPSAMIDAEVPYPLCRFVVDLLGGECSDGSLFRSDNSFDSFSDVLADLEQMMKNPEAFIHLGVRDQWKLAFGEKMHGREAEKGKLLEVASRITGVTSNDALLEALVLVHSDDKQQIVLVTGNAGAGKSHLVLETRKSLENHGWLFLCCKFDRIVHSEPLSVMANAFDEFLLHFVGNSRQIRIKASLKKLMEPEDIAILAKHVPCLVNYVDGPLQHIHEFQVNKEQIHQLFGKLIKVLSAVGPVVLFADDLQWADATSIDLFLALSKASEPNLSSDGCAERQPKTLLIGSYRDNEVQDNKQLQEMLDQLKTTKSVQVTEILVGGFDGGTLNAIVSESLCLPLRRTKPLTEIILQKTDGIIIHIIEFIGRLTMERILCHSFVKGWEWDSDVIESCPISESVAELFTFKLRTLSMFGIRNLCRSAHNQLHSRIRRREKCQH
jgi:ATP-dependent RNA helicase DDX31/DBP7